MAPYLRAPALSLVYLTLLSLKTTNILILQRYLKSFMGYLQRSVGLGDRSLEVLYDLKTKAVVTVEWIWGSPRSDAFDDVGLRSRKQLFEWVFLPRGDRVNSKAGV